MIQIPHWRILEVNMEERKSFVEKYADKNENNSSKFRFSKFKFAFPKINQDLFYKYFVFIITVSLAFIAFNAYLKTSLKLDNRYEIIHGDLTPTILLDKRTGLTWRNEVCDDKQKVPNCWSIMDFEADYINTPIGEQKRRDEDVKQQAELLKLNNPSKK